MFFILCPPTEILQCFPLHILTEKTQRLDSICTSIDAMKQCPLVGYSSIWSQNLSFGGG